MADKTTFIKIDRNIVYWRWFTNPKILSVFLWLLIEANYKEGHFQKDIIKRGSLATSNAHIADKCGLTIQNVRTALASLEETGEITRESRNHYQIITVVNYDSYQLDRPKQVDQNDDPYQFRSIRTDSGTNKQLTTIKESNKGITSKKKKCKKESPSPSPLNGGGDVPNAEKLKPIDEGTVDDIPEEYRDFCETYPDYWRHRNR